jgi:transcription elongation factor
MIVPKYHIKKNDLVMVINGKEKGKSGRVLKGEGAHRKDQFRQKTFSPSWETETGRDFGKRGTPSYLECDAPL